MKLAAFDLEIAKEIPDGVDDWQTVAPLGISCAAVALSDEDEPRFWKGIPQMTEAECRSLVTDLQTLQENGYTFLTWNGCGFDFAVLAQESGLKDECAALAMTHVDLMLMVTFRKGWFLSLEKALKGAGLPGKLKEVTLSNGTMVNDMDGAKAPGFWAAGEHEAVLAYLREDVNQMLRLADVIREKKAIRWRSNSGNPQVVSVSKLLAVRECLEIPEPDVSWMDNPPSRQAFVRWMSSPLA